MALALRPLAGNRGCLAWPGEASRTQEARGAARYEALDRPADGSAAGPAFFFIVRGVHHPGSEEMCEKHRTTPTPAAAPPSAVDRTGRQPRPCKPADVRRAVEHA